MDEITTLQKRDVSLTVISHRIRNRKEQIWKIERSIEAENANPEQFTKKLARLHTQVDVLTAVRDDLRVLYPSELKTEILVPLSDVEAIPEGRPKPGESLYFAFCYMADEYGVYLTSAEIEALKEVINGNIPGLENIIY